MKTFITYSMIIICFTSCQVSKDKLLIENFVKKYIINNTELSTDGIEEFITLFDYKKELRLEFITYFLEIQQKDLINKGNFEIFSYKEFMDSNIIRREKVEFPKNYKNIYFLVADSTEIGFYIIDEHKIISFFCANIRKRETDKGHPFFLNKENGKN